MTNPPRLPGPGAFPATNTVHWPTGPVDACDAHTEQLQKVSRVLGYHVGVTPALSEGAQCSNCVNEAKKLDDGSQQKYCSDFVNDRA